MERDGEFEIGTDGNSGSLPVLAPLLPLAVANAGRMMSPNVFAGETLLGGRGPFHTFFHGGTAG